MAKDNRGRRPKISNDELDLEILKYKDDILSTDGQGKIFNLNILMIIYFL